MAKMTTTVKIDTKALQRIIQSMPDNAHALLVEMASDMGDAYTRSAPRDTGAMAESAYAMLDDGAYQHGSKTSVGAIEAEVASRRPEAGMTELPTPDSRFVAFVAPVVKYWVYQHYGSHGRAGRPTLTEAANTVQRNIRSKYVRSFAKIITGK